jgi:hypothetical protein
MKKSSQAEQMRVAENVLSFPKEPKISVQDKQLSLELEEAEKARRVWSVSLVDLGRRDLKLAHPLVIQIEDYGAEFVASWPEVEAWGSGDTEADAVNCLKDAIVSLQEELDAVDDESLGKLPLRWKLALEAVLTQKGSAS